MISEDLSTSLKRSFAEARELQSETVSIEQLLLALLHNPRVADVLLACSVHVGDLRQDLSAIVRDNKPPAPRSSAVEPLASPEYERTLQRAITRVLAIRGGDTHSTGWRRAAARVLAIFKRPPNRLAVDGSDVLVAIFGESESQAAQALKRHGASRYDVTNFIAHGIRKSDLTDLALAKALPSGSVDIVLVNDDFTPMEFVVKILQEQFMLDLESAVKIMLKIHRDGHAVCGRFASDVAANKASLVRTAARDEEHPLRCIVQSA